MELNERIILELGFTQYDKKTIQDEKGWWIKSNGYKFSIWESVDHECYKFFPKGVDMSLANDFPITHPSFFDVMDHIGMDQFNLVTHVDEIFGSIAEKFTDVGIREQKRQVRDVLGLNLKD